VKVSRPPFALFAPDQYQNRPDPGKTRSSPGTIQTAPSIDSGHLRLV